MFLLIYIHGVRPCQRSRTLHITISHDNFRSRSGPARPGDSWIIQHHYEFTPCLVRFRCLLKYFQRFLFISFFPPGKSLSFCMYIFTVYVYSQSAFPCYVYIRNVYLYVFSICMYILIRCLPTFSFCIHILILCIGITILNCNYNLHILSENSHSICVFSIVWKILQFRPQYRQVIAYNLKSIINIFNQVHFDKWISQMHNLVYESGGCGFTSRRARQILFVLFW